MASNAFMHKRERTSQLLRAQWPSYRFLGESQIQFRLADYAITMVNLQKKNYLFL
jgi:hypothetical protein